MAEQFNINCPVDKYINKNGRLGRKEVQSVRGRRNDDGTCDSRRLVKSEEESDRNFGKVSAAGLDEDKMRLTVFLMILLVAMAVAMPSAGQQRSLDKRSPSTDEDDWINGGFRVSRRRRDGAPGSAGGSPSPLEGPVEAALNSLGVSDSAAVQRVVSDIFNSDNPLQALSSDLPVVGSLLRPIADIVGLPPDMVGAVFSFISDLLEFMRAIFPGVLPI